MEVSAFDKFMANMNTETFTQLVLQYKGIGAAAIMAFGIFVIIKFFENQTRRNNILDRGFKGIRAYQTRDRVQREMEVAKDETRDLLGMVFTLLFVLVGSLGTWVAVEVFFCNDALQCLLKSMSMMGSALFFFVILLLVFAIWVRKAVTLLHNRIDVLEKRVISG